MKLCWCPVTNSTLDLRVPHFCRHQTEIIPWVPMFLLFYLSLPYVFTYSSYRSPLICVRMLCLPHDSMLWMTRAHARTTPRRSSPPFRTVAWSSTFPPTCLCRSRPWPPLLPCRCPKSRPFACGSSWTTSWPRASTAPPRPYMCAPPTAAPRA